MHPAAAAVKADFACIDSRKFVKQAGMKITRLPSSTAVVPSRWPKNAFASETGRVLAVKSTPPLYGLALLCFGLLPNLVQADPLDQWTLRSHFATSSLLVGVAYGNSQFVAVGSQGAIMTSPDGITWTSRPSGTGAYLNGIAYGNNQFVTVGTAFVSGVSGVILTSPDGVNWTNRTSVRGVDLHGIAYANSQFVVVGGGGTVVTSADGVTWTSRTFGATGDITLQGITYGNNTFVAIGNFGAYPGILGTVAIGTSPDGITWANPTSVTDNQLLGIAYGNKQFVAVGYGSDGTIDGTLFTSPDGITWTNRISGTDDPLYGVAYGNNTFVAVGNSGMILQSGVVGPVQPGLGPVVLLPSGAAQVTLAGQAGQTYPVQASTNLMDWLTLTSVALTNTSGQFVDPAATNFPRRFYRAVAQ